MADSRRGKEAAVYSPTISSIENQRRTRDWDELEAAWAEERTPRKHDAPTGVDPFQEVDPRELDRWASLEFLHHLVMG